MRLLAIAFLGALAVCPTLSAQETSSGKVPTRREKLVLDQRDRKDLHEGSDPFHIVGLEQGDNGFRDRTPALLATDGQVTKVDTEELRQRQIAMLTGRSLFRRPPSSASGPSLAPVRDLAAVRHPSEGQEDPKENEQPTGDRESLLVIAACAFGCGLVAFVAKKLAL